MMSDDLLKGTVNEAIASNGLKKVERILPRSHHFTHRVDIFNSIVRQFMKTSFN
jgi:hypothetical protein